MIDCKGKIIKKTSNYQIQFYYAFLMSRLSQFHHSRIAPWQLEDANLQAEHFSPHRMILTPKKRQVRSCNSPKRSSQSKSKLQPSRTAVKITRINISPDKNTYPKTNRDPFSTYTPKNNHIGIFQRKTRRASPELSPCTPAKNTIMTIDTWRKESKRILSSMSKKKVGDWRYQKQKEILKEMIEGAKDKILTIYFFQKIFRAQNEERYILIDEYFLIRCNLRKEKQDCGFYQEQNLVFKATDDLVNFDETKIKFKMEFSRENQLDSYAKIRYNNQPENENVKVLVINFTITDPNNFFVDQLKAKERKRLKVDFQKDESNKKFEICWDCFMLTIYNQKQGEFSLQRGKIQVNRIHLQKHFNLAFQGGGAKGIAYVGAYKSIRQQKCKITQNQELSIPIKITMGSSAGGIIALAISTGIPEYELEKICYKMNSIHRQDRFVQNDKAFDDYGNEITSKQILKNLTKIFEEFGIIQSDVLKSIWNSFQERMQASEIEDKLLECLTIINPVIGQILTINQKQQVEIPRQGYWSRFKGLFTKNETKIVKRRKLNWEGLMLQGALMKGDAIHGIANECLIKFFIKKSSEIDLELYKEGRQREQLFEEELRECLEPEVNVCFEQAESYEERQNMQNELKSKRIVDVMEDHMYLSEQIFKLDLKDIAQNMKSTKQEKILCKFCGWYFQSSFDNT